MCSIWQRFLSSSNTVSAKERLDKIARSKALCWGGFVFLRTYLIRLYGLA
jgi:hypothetical protein